MILIADSGSTKTDWLAVDHMGKHVLSFQSPGINPMTQDASQISEILSASRELTDLKNDKSEVYFYGAGCSEEGRIETVTTALHHVLPAATIHVGHDLTGAVIAMCGDQPGFACILGTGSNAVFFDGKKEIKIVPSLGWALGDEGSGAWFGKQLLKDYCYLQLPQNIHAYLENDLAIDKEDILNAVYKMPNPNRYLAGFMPVLGKFREENYVQELLNRGFHEFIRFQVACYKNFSEYPANFVGSVALHFREELTKVCNSFGINTGNFIQRPVENIAAFLVKNKQV